VRKIYDSPLFQSALAAAPPARPRTAPLAGVESRMYAGARKSRLTAGFGSGETSADAELDSSLINLRARSRELVRDAAFARRARQVVVNNVIGSGIGVQAQIRSTRDTLRKDVNDAVETAWWKWCDADSCHTGGQLHFHDLERAAMAQVFEAGEVLIRIHPRRFGGSRVPLALELIEAERLASHYVQPTGLPPGAEYRMGVEHDAYGRPAAYWLRERHPGDLKWTVGGSERLTRVPADQIFHLRVITRWPQTRGEPWLHAVVRKLHDVDGYSESEVVAARAAAAYMGIIETPDQESPLAGTPQADGSRAFDLEPGLSVRLAPGEKFSSYSPNRPNAAMEAFMRHMLREIGVGADVPYESISGDYSQSNYSSSRLSLLESRDTWKHLQQWFIRSFREPLHRMWLQQAVLSGALPQVNRSEYAIDPSKYEAVQFKPRGWSWVDPTKEVAAYKEAVMAGFTTVSDVIAATGNGQDLEEVLDARERELQMMDDKGLKFDTSPGMATGQQPPAPPAPPAPAADEEDDDDDQPEAAQPQRVVSLRR
jgi:lambda family phage portal protein